MPQSTIDAIAEWSAARQREKTALREMKIVGREYHAVIDRLTVDHEAAMRDAAAARRKIAEDTDGFAWLSAVKD